MNRDISLLRTVFAGVALACVFTPVAAAGDAQALRTYTVQYREVDQTYAAEGVVEAVKQSTVAAQIAGRVVAVNFDVGDRVKKGQVIVRIDPAEVNQAYAASQAQVAQAEAMLRNAKAQHDRTQRLVEQKFMSAAAMDKAQADYQAAKAQLEVARAGSGQAASTRSYATVVAPYSGVVSARLVELGEMAVPGKPLMTGFDPGELRVSASMPQRELDMVRKLSSARVDFPALNKSVQASKVSILPAADAQTHTTQVRLDLPAGIEGLYPGMFARTYFAVGRMKKLLIPSAAVAKRSEVTGAYVVGASGDIRYRQLRLGEATAGDEVEVLAGLAPGDKVALDPVAALAALKRGGK
ncbi:MAG: efflux RND transporter periplasmic adaptor subunit [Burkholderiales bacterium]|nr:efflux RND transporter periplasmic adaptor subunit [Burkholderiales bacterium]